jgi:hypothetical protein
MSTNLIGMVVKDDMRGDGDLGDAGRAGGKRRVTCVWIPDAIGRTTSCGETRSQKPPPTRERDSRRAGDGGGAGARRVQQRRLGHQPGWRRRRLLVGRRERHSTATGSGNPAVDQEVAGSPASGGTLTVDLDEQVLPDLDPSYTPEAAAYRVIRGVFDSLVYEGSNGTFTPWLATK